MTQIPNFTPILRSNQQTPLTSAQCDANETNTATSVNALVSAINSITGYQYSTLAAIQSDKTTNVLKQGVYFISGSGLGVTIVVQGNGSSSMLTGWGAYSTFASLQADATSGNLPKGTYSVGNVNYTFANGILTQVSTIPFSNSNPNQGTPTYKQRAVTGDFFNGFGNSTLQGVSTSATTASAIIAMPNSFCKQLSPLDKGRLVTGSGIGTTIFLTDYTTTSITVSQTIASIASGTTITLDPDYCIPNPGVTGNFKCIIPVNPYNPYWTVTAPAKWADTIEVKVKGLVKVVQATGNLFAFVVKNIQSINVTSAVTSNTIPVSSTSGLTLANLGQPVFGMGIPVGSYLYSWIANTSITISNSLALTAVTVVGQKIYYGYVRNLVNNSNFVDGTGSINSFSSVAGVSELYTGNTVFNLNDSVKNFVFDNETDFSGQIQVWLMAGNTSTGYGTLPNFLQFAQPGGNLISNGGTNTQGTSFPHFTIELIITPGHKHKISDLFSVVEVSSANLTVGKWYVITQVGAAPWISLGAASATAGILFQCTAQNSAFFVGSKAFQVTDPVNTTCFGGNPNVTQANDSLYYMLYSRQSGVVTANPATFGYRTAVDPMGTWTEKTTASGLLPGVLSGTTYTFAGWTYVSGTFYLYALNNADNKVYLFSGATPETLVPQGIVFDAPSQNSTILQPCNPFPLFDGTNWFLYFSSKDKTTCASATISAAGILTLGAIPTGYFHAGQYIQSNTVTPGSVMGLQIVNYIASTGSGPNTVGAQYQLNTTSTQAVAAGTIVCDNSWLSGVAVSSTKTPQGPFVVNPPTQTSGFTVATGKYPMYELDQSYGSNSGADCVVYNSVTGVYNIYYQATWAAGQLVSSCEFYTYGTDGINFLTGSPIALARPQKTDFYSDPRSSGAVDANVIVRNGDVIMLLNEQQFNYSNYISIFDPYVNNIPYN